VCSSDLQHEPKQDVTDAMQAYLDLGSLITEFERRAVART
jgi:hypothetical protein